MDQVSAEKRLILGFLKKNDFPYVFRPVFFALRWCEDGVVFLWYFGVWVLGFLFLDIFVGLGMGFCRGVISGLWWVVVEMGSLCVERWKEDKVEIKKKFGCKTPVECKTMVVLRYFNCGPCKNWVSQESEYTCENWVRKLVAFLTCGLWCGGGNRKMREQEKIIEKIKQFEDDPV